MAFHDMYLAVSLLTILVPFINRGKAFWKASYLAYPSKGGGIWLCCLFDYNPAKFKQFNLIISKLNQLKYMEAFKH